MSDNFSLRTFFEFTFGGLKKAAWAPISVFIFHVILTRGLNAYNTYPDLDIPMHFIGGAVICFFYWMATRAPYADLYLGKHTKFSIFVMLLALTGLTTVIWEFAEWIADHYFAQTAQVSITDTMGDMFLGLCGGFMISLIAAFQQKP